jgi:hypothetical protein
MISRRKLQEKKALAQVLTVEVYQKHPRASRRFRNGRISSGPYESKLSVSRLQNNLLLTNAMRATALHLQSKTLPATVSEPNADIVAETPSAQGVRNSATPAPAPAAKTPTAQAQESPSRALPGAGKKKRKRMLASRCRNTD